MDRSIALLPTAYCLLPQFGEQMPSSRKSYPGLLGPVPPRCARAGLAAGRQGAVRGHRVHHARRAGAGGHRGARARPAAGRDGVRGELPRLQEPGRAEDLEERRAVRAGDRQRPGQRRAPHRRSHGYRQDRQDRARDPARRPFRHRLRQAGRRADVPYVRDRGVAGHVDLFSLGPRPASMWSRSATARVRRARARSDGEDIAS